MQAGAGQDLGDLHLADVMPSEYFGTNRLRQTLYNVDGVVTGLIDAKGKLTQYLVDDFDEVTATIDPSGHQTDEYTDRLFIKLDS